jgi:hypothetical protein
MIFTISGWSFETASVHSVRYRYSLRRLVIEFANRTVQIEMPQDLGERYLIELSTVWNEDRSC